MGSTSCGSKDTGLHRGAWSAEEDKILSECIRIHGEGGWKSLPYKAGLERSGKSCRFRWLNYLRPDIKRGNISPDEEDLIFRLHRLIGNRWSLIAGRLPGRTDNEIKNYWNTHLGKKKASKGAVPKSKNFNSRLNSQSRREGDHTLKTIPARPAAVRTRRGCNEPKNNGNFDHHDMKFESEIPMTTKSLSKLLGDESIAGSDVDVIDFNMSPAYSNLLSSPWDFSSDFRFPEFRAMPSDFLEEQCFV